MKRITGMVHELIEDEKIGSRFRRRMAILGPIENMPQVTTSAIYSKIKVFRPKFEQLENVYTDLCKDLSRKYPNSMIKTSTEESINNVIREHSNLEFARSSKFI